MSNEKGFTLVELMATIAILGVLLLIAVPSITAFQRKIQQNQIKKDAELFLLLAKQEIKTNTNRSGPVIEVKLSELDKDKLNGEYDEENSIVKASDCDFTGEIYACNSYSYTLKNNKYIYEDGIFK